MAPITQKVDPRLKRKRIIVVGSSGAGKSTLIRLFLAIYPDARLSVSCTSRTIRANEVDGKDYFFISREEFLKRKELGLFAETNEHHGTVKQGDLYGTLLSECSVEEGTVIFDVEVNGAAALKKLFPDAITIFILPPSKAELRLRLEKRIEEGNLKPEQLVPRLERYEYEKQYADECGYSFVNDNLYLCFVEFARAIFTELSK